MKNIIIILLTISALILLTACEENTSPEIFDHNSTLQGYVSYTEGSADTLLAQITASRDNIVLASTVTDTSGYYLMTGLSAGEYFISVKLSGYSTQSFTVNLLNNQTVTADTVEMMPMLSMQFDTKTVDGEIDNGWLPVYSDEHDSNWGPNDFSALYLAYDDEYLYIAVTGEFSTSDNTASICIDKDGNGDTGINDFATVNGGDIGNRIRKNITAPESFGADVIINSGWGLSDGEGIVSLDNPSAVDNALLEDVIISMNASVMEFAISLEELYNGMNLPTRLSLIAYIGGGGDEYFANDVIPQGGGDFEGIFYDVYTIGY